MHENKERYDSFDFVCKNCKDKEKEMKKSVELLCDGVETVTEFSYLGDRLNATGECEVTIRL